MKIYLKPKNCPLSIGARQLANKRRNKQTNNNVTSRKVNNHKKDI